MLSLGFQAVFTEIFLTMVIARDGGYIKNGNIYPTIHTNSISLFKKKINLVNDKTFMASLLDSWNVISHQPE